MRETLKLKLAIEYGYLIIEAAGRFKIGKVYS